MLPARYDDDDDDFDENRAVSIFNGKSPNVVDKFTHLGSNILSTESNVNIPRGITWAAIDWLSMIWRFFLIEKINLYFFQTDTVSVL